MSNFKFPSFRLTRAKFVTILSDFGVYTVLLFSWALVVSIVLSLIAADPLIGKFTGEHITEDSMLLGPLSFGMLVSFATSGLVFGAITVLKMLWDFKAHFAWIVVMGVVVGLLMVADSYLDAMSVDISRFGGIVDVSIALTPPEAFSHNVYRTLVAGVSLIGEPLGMACIVLFPIIKDVILKSLRENLPGANKPQHNQHNQGNQHRQGNQSRHNNNPYAYPRAAQGQAKVVQAQPQHRSAAPPTHTVEAARELMQELTYHPTALKNREVHAAPRQAPDEERRSDPSDTKPRMVWH